MQCVCCLCVCVCARACVSVLPSFRNGNGTCPYCSCLRVICASLRDGCYGSCPHRSYLRVCLAGVVDSDSLLARDAFIANGRASGCVASSRPVQPPCVLWL